MMDIVCTGSIAYDYLMTFPGCFKDHILPEKLSTISLSFLVDSMIRQRGGTAPNIAYSIALLGGKPRLMGTVGEDFMDYRVWLESHGIITQSVKVIQGEYTASFFATTDKSNAQIASFYPGAMAHAAELKLADLTGNKPDLVVISPNDPTAMEDLPRECKELGIPYLYDPSQQLVRMDAKTMREGVEGAFALFLNDYEFGLLQKATGMSLEDVLNQVTLLVVTCGENGALVYADGKEFQIPVVPPDEILDPTGVGDAFRGGFLTGLRLEMDWQTCGQLGALAATYCLEKCGPQSQSYTRSEFVKRYHAVFGDDEKVNILLK
jgi:adenosine kinase